MSSAPTATAKSSQKARDIGVLRAAFRGDKKWYDNTWNIMREYNNHAANTTGPPLFAATWTEMEKKLAPLFQQIEISTSVESPLSPSPTTEAIKRFNHAINLMVSFEHTTTNSACQAVVAWFGQNDLPDYRQTAFLRHAFNEHHDTVVDLTAKTWSNFHYAWAELEAGEDYNDPAFPMSEGLTHAASPIVSGDWTKDAYSEKDEWVYKNRFLIGKRYAPREEGWGWGY